MGAMDEIVRPTLGRDVYIAPTAYVGGDVILCVTRSGFLEQIDKPCGNPVYYPFTLV